MRHAIPICALALCFSGCRSDRPDVLASERIGAATESITARDPAPAADPATNFSRPADSTTESATEDAEDVEDRAEGANMSVDSDDGRAANASAADAEDARDLPVEGALEVVVVNAPSAAADELAMSVDPRLVDAPVASYPDEQAAQSEADAVAAAEQAARMEEEQGLASDAAGVVPAPVIVVSQPVGAPAGAGRPTSRAGAAPASRAIDPGRAVGGTTPPTAGGVPQPATGANPATPVGGLPDPGPPANAATHAGGIPGTGEAPGATTPNTPGVAPRRAQPPPPVPGRAPVAPRGAR